MGKIGHGRIIIQYWVVIELSCTGMIGCCLVQSKSDPGVKLSIQVKFFASLREKLQLDECQLEAQQAATVAQVWQITTKGQPVPDNLLSAINMEYVAFDHPVTDGDEVAFFPPVTGG